MIAMFTLGRIVATPGALRALERANQSAAFFLTRHAAADWGELDPEDIRENEYSVAHGFRLLSSYATAVATSFGSSPKPTDPQPPCFCRTSINRAKAVWLQPRSSPATLIGLASSSSSKSYLKSTKEKTKYVGN